MPVSEQMANIGSEISRALNWRNKGNKELSRKAVFRALGLVDLSLRSSNIFSRLKELTRLRETIVNYFCGSNQFASSESLWRKYFDHFNYAVRKNH